MKRLLAALAALIVGPPMLIIGALIAYPFAYMIITGTRPPCIAPVSYHLGRMRWIIQRDEMGWGEEVEWSLNHLKQCTADKRHLAETLLAEKNGTLVSLGMEMVVQEGWDDGHRLLSRYRNDKRWNFQLTHNDEYSRLLLALWKIRKNMPLSKEDEEVMGRWPEKYFDFGRVGMVAPEKALHPAVGNALL